MLETFLKVLIVVNAATEADAKHQAQILARMSGWNETAKKITVKGA